MWTRIFKCWWCKNRFDSGIEEIRNWISRYCSKQCRLDSSRAIKRKANDKVKLRKTKAKDKKANSISTLTKKADKIWSECVKINYNYECQVEWCDKKEYLNSHHLYTRARRATRWDINNWICLCAWHHTLSSNFSAHLTPLEFFEWLEGIKWRDWIDELSKSSRSVIKVTPELLHNHIKELNEFKAKHW